jgi:hypothetical protein
MTREPPEPSDRDVDYLKLAAALLLEGAIFQLILFYLRLPEEK